MEKGAASPGRWQVWQCFRKIGATSLVNVGGGLLGSCPSAYPAQHSAPASRMDKHLMNFPTSRLDLAKQKCDRTGKLADGRWIYVFLHLAAHSCSTLVPEQGHIGPNTGPRRDLSC